MIEQARAELAPNGVLRAGVNLSNFLLVTGKSANGDPEGVSPDMAAAVAAKLGVDIQYVPYPSPGEVADASTKDLWDIGLIGAEPERAKTIMFSAAYCEIEATYMVPDGSTITSIDDVDRAGVRIAVAGRSAYHLWLEDHIKNAELVVASGLNGSFDAFVESKLDVLAGLRPRLIDDVKKVPGARILDGQFSAVQQAIGTRLDCPKGAEFIRQFVEEAKASGLVGELIEKHAVTGRLSVAPAA
jgi:polar amino acid transport system substrate-binding protein